MFGSAHKELPASEMPRNGESFFVAIEFNQKLGESILKYHVSVAFGNICGDPLPFPPLQIPFFLYLDCEHFPTLQVAWLPFTMTSVFNLTNCFAVLHRK